MCLERINHRAGFEVPRIRETRHYLFVSNDRAPREEVKTMMTATLQKLVRDPRTGEVHLPHERVEILGVLRNLDRTLLRVKWQTGSDCIVFPDDIEDEDRPVRSPEIHLQ